MSMVTHKALKLDVSMSTLYSMRDSGMTNKEIANSLGCSYQTILNYIGPAPKKDKPEQKEKRHYERHKKEVAAETQEQYVQEEQSHQETAPAVIESAVIVKPVEPVQQTVVEKLTARDSLVLMFECKKVVANGKHCKYTIDIDSKTISLDDGILQGTMTREQLQNVIFELKECYSKLCLCK